MKKLILGAVALSFASAFAPMTATAKTVEKVIIKHPHHQVHCRTVKTKVRHHGHWIVRVKKVCK